MPAPQIGVQNIPDWLVRQSVPDWLRRQNPSADSNSLTGMYRNFLTRNPTSQGASGLVSRYQSYLGRNPNAPGNRQLGNFPAPNPAPNPNRPGGGTPPGSAPPPAAPPPASPPPAGGQPGTPGRPGPGYRDIYDVYRSAVPIMQQEATDAISKAMATAGFSGNRYGTAAVRAAGEIGADTALRQNQLLTSLMHQQNEADANRSLQSTDQAIRLGGLEHQIQRDRLDQLFNFGRYEQGRQDDFARLAYDDFNANRYGMLPLLIQFAASQSGGSGPTPYAIQHPGGTGIADWVTLLSGLLR